MQCDFQRHSFGEENRAIFSPDMANARQQYVLESQNVLCTCKQRYSYFKSESFFCDKVPKHLSRRHRLGAPVWDQQRSAFDAEEMQMRQLSADLEHAKAWAGEGNWKPQGLDDIVSSIFGFR